MLAIEGVNSSGINLAWLVNLNLGEHFRPAHLPAEPDLYGKAFEYSLKYPDLSLGWRRFYHFEESAVHHHYLTVQIKFSSDQDQ